MDSRCKRVANILINEIGKYPVHPPEKLRGYAFRAWTKNFQMALDFKTTSNSCDMKMAISRGGDKHSIATLKRSVLKEVKSTREAHPWLFDKLLDDCVKQPDGLVILSAILTCLAEGERHLLT